MPDPPLCFVVMPFRPELHYLYLYLQRHIAEKHGLRVERGDSRILTKPLLEKIRDQIASADLVVADISFANPNVFYEIGLAHALDKPVLFLTQDNPGAAPVDVRSYEFISYKLEDHWKLFADLDKAIGDAFGAKYRPLYDHALQLLGDFNAGTSSTYFPVLAEEFRSRVLLAEQPRGIPAREDAASFAEFFLPIVFANPADLPLMRKVAQWVDAMRPANAGQTAPPAAP